MQDNKFFTSNPMFGHCYVPVQTMKKIYSPENGLCEGTVFPELSTCYKPFQSMEVIEYLKNYKERGCC